MTSSTSNLITDLRESLPPLLPDFLRGRRWFGGKARKIHSAEIMDIIPMFSRATDVYLFLVRVRYAEFGDEIYGLPLELAPKTVSATGSSLKVPLARNRESIVLDDALLSQPFLTFLLEAISRHQNFAGFHGEVRAVSLRTSWTPAEKSLPPVPMKVEQSNSSVLYGREFILKLFRRLA